MGFIVGFAVGSVLATASTEQQRAKASEAAARASRRVQDSKVGRAVSNSATQVADAASGRAAGAVDSVGEALTDAIEGTAV